MRKLTFEITSSKKKKQKKKTKKNTRMMNRNSRKRVLGKLENIEQLGC